MSSRIEKFEDLTVWQESMVLAEIVYKEMRICKDFGFRDQIQRSSVSVPSNIAEGFDRQTNKEFIQFLYIAKGSCSELRTQLYLSKRFKYIEPEKCNDLIELSKKVSSMLFKLIKVRKEKFS